MFLVNEPGLGTLALTPFPSSVGWDEIWTHDVLIVDIDSFNFDHI